MSRDSFRRRRCQPAVVPGVFLVAALAVFLTASFAVPLLAPGAAVAAGAVQNGESVCITDDAGERVCLDRPARRIIPLYAALSEILADLGLEDRIIARTQSDIAGNAAASGDGPAAVPFVGTHIRPNAEIIVALAPDLVLQFEGREEAGVMAAQLRRLGLNVARFRIDSFEGLFSAIRRIGMLTGTDGKADALVESLAGRLLAVRRRTNEWDTRLSDASLPPAVMLQREAWSRPSVFFEVRYPNLLGAGADSMVSRIITAAGGRNALAGHPGRMIRLNEEMLLALAPDVYLVQQGPMNPRPVPESAASEASGTPGIPLADRPHFRGLTPIRLVVPEALFSRPSPRAVAAVELLAHYLAVQRLFRSMVEKP